MGWMLSPEQCRAARGWLDWSQEDLAQKANVSLSTVRNFEKGRSVPIPNNLDAMRDAIEEAGIRLAFEGDVASGVVLADPRRKARELADHQSASD